MIMLKTEQTFSQVCYATLLLASSQNCLYKNIKYNSQLTGCELLADAFSLYFFENFLHSKKDYSARATHYFSL